MRFVSFIILQLIVIVSLIVICIKKSAKLIEYLKIKKYEKTIEETEDFDAMYELGKLYLKNENYEMAEKYFKMAAVKNDTGIIVYLAIALMQNGKYEESKKYFKIAVDRKNATAMFDLAVLYEVLGKYEESKKYLVMAEKNGFKDMTLMLGLLNRLDEKC